MDLYLRLQIGWDALFLLNMKAFSKMSIFYESLAITNLIVTEDTDKLLPFDLLESMARWKAWITPNEISAYEKKAKKNIRTIWFSLILQFYQVKIILETACEEKKLIQIFLHFIF